MRLINYSGVAVILMYMASATHAQNSSKYYTSVKKHIYYIEHEQTHDWFEALTDCARRNMSLVTIEDISKSQEINTLVLKTFGENVVLWVGGYAVGSSRQFTWIRTGKPFDYTFWDKDQPSSDSHNQFCVQIGYTTLMQWNDFQCTAQRGYICEYIPAPLGANKDLSNNAIVPRLFWESGCNSVIITVLLNVVVFVNMHKLMA